MKTLLFLLLASIAGFAQVAPINRQGLKFERIIVGSDTVETGRIVGVEVQLSPDTTISVAHSRTLELLEMREDFDLEMVVYTRVNYYTADGKMLMVDAIAKDSTLSPDLKTLRSRLFQSFQLAPKSTRGSFVNPSTGVLVPIGTQGAIPEIMLYQQLTKTALVAMGVTTNAETRPQRMRYNMLAAQLRTIAARIGL